MNNKQHQFSHTAGFTLIEVMIAMAVFIIVALGALNYQYFAALHARTAAAQMTATRAGQLLIDDWKSTGGSPAYDPTYLNLGFTESDSSDGYEITVDNLPMYMILSNSTVEQEEEAQVTLRQIIVQVNWRNDHRTPSVQEGENSSIILTAYIRGDASGG